ncbi:hypothetical protein BKA80DRAFT_252325 [Phyllosticta citrichinensis]
MSVGVGVEKRTGVSGCPSAGAPDLPQAQARPKARATTQTLNTIASTSPPSHLIALAARHTSAYVACPAYHAPQSPRKGCIRREPVSSAASPRTIPLRPAQRSLMARPGSAGHTLKPIGQASPLAQEQTSSTSPAPSTTASGFDALDTLDTMAKNLRSMASAISGNAATSSTRSAPAETALTATARPQRMPGGHGTTTDEQSQICALTSAWSSGFDSVRAATESLWGPPCDATLPRATRESVYLLKVLQRSLVWLRGLLGNKWVVCVAWPKG